MGSRRRCCCGSTTPTTCCDPCKVPQKDLTYTQEFWLAGFPSTFLYSSTITLTYSTTGPNPWEQQWTGTMTCPDGVGRAVTLTCAFVSGHNPLLGTFLNLDFPLNDPPYTVGTGGRPHFKNFTTAWGTVGSYTCAPFYATLDLWDQVDLNYRGKSTISDPSPGDENNCCLGSTVVSGCGGNGVPGATYSVWVDSGKSQSIATGTTDTGSAAFAFDNVFCGLSRYREVSHPRFTTLAGSKTFGLGVNTSDSLGTPIAGYHCVTACGSPVSDTLHATHPKFGSIAYIYSSGSWVASISYSYPGAGACAAKAVTVTCAWDGNTTYTEAWKVDGSNCPDDAGTTTHTATWVNDALTCYAPGISSFEKVFTLTPAAGAEVNLYGASALANHITE